ncbi:type II toxin-antitoxin system VapC family toxin [Nitrospira sp. BLG_1]|uniref:type II toxin-antitoxin system VapC family toxin n=1 Tax=Nitrospira sp. BLG_1 TaxID=3395883 RepID=UPI0039BC50DF
MRRLILDTNLYIDWFNTGAHEPLLFQSDAVKMMSTVVMMELLAGAHAVRDRTRLHDLFRTFRKLGRLLVPSAEVYEDAGGVLRQLQAVHGYRLRQAHSLTNDVLIALSARAVGGTVVTQNQRDFLAIQSIRPFKLSLV